MAEVDGTKAGTETPGRAPLARGLRRHLPALLRYPIIASCGAAVAALASYLLRSIGF